MGKRGSYINFFFTQLKEHFFQYFVVFFQTGPHDPISTKLLKSLDQSNNPGINEFPCKIITVSMDSVETIKDWIRDTNGMSDFDVPMLSDKENDLARQFGVSIDGFKC